MGNMSKQQEDVVIIQGVVTEVLPDRRFRVKADVANADVEHIILAYLSGSMAKHRIRVLEGDRVVVACSPYDLTKGRVIRRIT